MQKRKPEPDPPRALYPKLRPRRNGLKPEHVVAHQRARLRGAVVEAVNTKGYAATSVAELIALAGVSRATFYEHFESKEACFLASFEEILANAAERITTAYRREPDLPSALRAAYQAFVTELIENPRGARVVLVDILAMDSALQRAEGLRLGFEGTLVENPGLLGGVVLPPTVLTAILSGVWQVARRRLLEDRLEELRGIGDELLLWMAAYNSPAAAQLSTQPPRIVKVPSLPAADEEPDPHTRMLRTAADLAAHEGYRQLTAARIIDDAHVADETFFGTYEDTEQCVVAALELRAAEVLASMLRARPSTEHWSDGVQLRIGRLLGQMAAEPTLAPLAFVETFTLGPAGVQLREGLMKRIEQMMVRHAPTPDALSGVVAEAIVGAVWGLIYDWSARGESERLGGLSEYASYIVLAPVLGPEEAVKSIVSARSSEALLRDP